MIDWIGSRRIVYSERKKYQLGKSGMIYNRGRQIVLENEHTGEHVAVKVVQYDSMQGWLAENGEGDWQWYHEKENQNWPEGTEFWKYIKRVG